MSGDPNSQAINVDLPTQEILLAASQHDIPTLRSLIQSHQSTFDECRPVDIQDPETGFTPLHAAIAACESDDNAVEDGMASQEEELEGGRETVQFLLEEGAIWNQLDENGETPGCIALRLKLEELYGMMVDAGVRAEMLLARLEGGGYEMIGDGEDDEEVEVMAEDAKERISSITNGDSELDVGQDVTSTQYLSSALSLSSDKLLDDQQNGVMMAWEADIMEKSANTLLYKSELRVLNIGFGMGIIDGCIESHANKPRIHHIVEAHADVLDEMKFKGWHRKPSVVVHEGKWQDVLPKLAAEGEVFDAIYFDTFAESYAQFRDFFSEQVIGLLDPEGRWSFFNGMGADRQISYDVYQKVVEMDLFESGFDIDWQEVEVPVLEKDWNGVKRSYFNIKNYRLGLARFMD